MHTYKVGPTSGSFLIVQAEYFKMLYDGISGMDAYFYVTKTNPGPRLGDPSTTEEVQVAFVARPRFVVFDDQWVLRSQGIDKAL